MEGLAPTITVEDGNGGDVAVDKLVNDIEDRRLHIGRFKVFVGAKLEVLQRLPEQLGLSDVDSNEFQDTVLCDHANNHGTSSLVVDVYKRNATSPRLEHTTTCFVERTLRMYRNRLQWCYTNSFLDIWIRVNQRSVSRTVVAGMSPLRLFSLN